MFTIDERYVPLFYIAFALILTAFVIWSIRRTFFLRSRLNTAFKNLTKDITGIDSGNLPTLQTWSASAFSKIRLPAYTLTRSNIFFIQKTNIQLVIKDKSAALLYFKLFFEHRLFRQPQGIVQLKTTNHDISLQFYYNNGKSRRMYLLTIKK